jgi:F-type H+-transporting ATPase subunit delta
VKGVHRSVARRWARALLDVALERERAGGKGPEALWDELRLLSSLVRENHDLVSALTHPAIPNEQRQKAARVLCAESQASELSTRLLGMLIERERLLWLPEISALYTEVWNAQRGVAQAEAITPSPLDLKTLTRMGKALGRSTGLEVEVTGRTDEAILGGVLVRMAGKTFDGTVRSRLRLLRHALTQGA